MAGRFVNLDRQTPRLLPCDLRDWVPADHIVHFILDAVEQMPLTHFHVDHRGTGSEQYPPAMTLACSSTATPPTPFGSRSIKAATHSDVAVRFLCANTHADRDSICALRTAHATARQQQRDAGKKPRGKDPPPFQANNQADRRPNAERSCDGLSQNDLLPAARAAMRIPPPKSFLKSDRLPAACRT